MDYIKVRSKISGKTGKMPVDKFDPVRYERIAEDDVQAKPLSQPKDEKRILGGALPTIGGIFGGIGGAALGAPTGPGALATGAGGAALGAASGVAIENLLQNLLGWQKQTPRQQLGEAGTEAAYSAGAELAGGLGAKIVAKPLAKLTSKVLPKALIKTALPEAPKLASKYETKVALGETGETLADFVTKKNISGSAKQLVRIGDKGLKQTEKVIISKLEKLPKKRALQALGESLGKTVNNVATQLTGEGEEKALNKALMEFINKKAPLVTDDGWKGLWNLRKQLDKMGKGIASTEAGAVKKKFISELANQLRSILSPLVPEVMEKQGYGRLKTAAARSLARSPFSRGDVIPLIIGGGAGAVTGGLPGAALGVAAAKAPFSPGFATRLAKFLRGAGPALNVTAETAPRAVSQTLSRLLFGQ